MTILGNVAGVKVEIGFGVDAVGGDFFVLDDPVKGELDNATYLLAPSTVFVDVTEHVAAITTDRGRERELDEYGTGVATVTFNDDDRTFDPAYEGVAGHIDFPGASGNYCSVPDEDDLDITGDITIVARIAPDDWTPGAVNDIAAKRAEAGQISWEWRLLTAGTFQLVWSTDGSAVSFANSTVSVGAVDGAWKWVAATLDVDNGAAGRDVRFWTSDDGSSWAQLGSTVTQAGTTSIFSSTSIVEIGSALTGTLFPFAGNISHVSIRDGIGPSGTVGGTEVFGFDAEDDLRGVDADADEFTASTLQTVTVNRSGDPETTIVPTDAPYAGELVPMKRIEITWNDDELFTGWVNDWSVMYEPGDNLSRVTAACVDGFAILANQELAEIVAAHSGDLSGERISRVLDLSEVDYPASRSIDDGNSTLGATTFGQNALAYLQACSVAEAGYLFVAADGTLTFRNRLSVLNAPSDATFVDEGDGIRYMTVTQRSSADLLFTRVTGESETTGNEVTASDSEAIDKFLIRTLDLGALFTIDDDETQGLVDYHLERFKQPEVRFQTATINTGALASGAIETLMSLDLTDVVTVEREPLRLGSISRRSIVDGIRHEINPGSWKTEVSFANADTRVFLQLDDEVFGELDACRLAF